MTNDRPRFWAFHGFLGQPTDWEPFYKHFKTPNLKSWDLNSVVEKLSYPNKLELLKRFSYDLRQEKPILIGYSMGGRIAIELAAMNPGFYRGLILLSTNYGLYLKTESKKRLLIDQNWAVRFLSEDWNSIITDWNGQRVFSGDAEREFIESDYRRETLSYWLNEWSLGLQSNYFEFLAEGKTPLLSIYGENDKKFANLWGRMRPLVSDTLQIVELPGAGHRVLEQIDKVPPEIVQKFINLC